MGLSSSTLTTPCYPLPMTRTNITIPDIFYKIEYNSARIPGIDNQSDLSQGANCQVFAYELLRHNGIQPPVYRSSELWSDTQTTVIVDSPQPLDLLLYNFNDQAYGAHVAVALGNDELIHLSAVNRIAEITTHQAMLQNPRYAVSIGAKRVYSATSLIPYSLSRIY